MEERGDTEPGVLQNGKRSQNTPVGDGNTRRWKQLGGKYRKDTSGPKHQKSFVFVEGIQGIREIQGQQWESGAWGCLWHPGQGTEPRWIEPRVLSKDGTGSQGETTPLELPNVAPPHGLTSDHTGKAFPNCLRLLSTRIINCKDRACVSLWICTDPDPIMALVSPGIFISI